LDGYASPQHINCLLLSYIIHIWLSYSLSYNKSLSNAAFGVTSVDFAEWNVYVNCNSYICRDGGIISRARNGAIFDSLGL